MTKVVLLQLSESGSPAARMSAVAGRLRELARGGAGASAGTGSDVELVLLPELWQVGAFDVDGFADAAEPMDGPFVARMSEAARAAGVWLHAGSFVERAGDDLYNTSVLFDDRGDLVAHYRKIHLFGFSSGEADLLTGGSELVVVDTPLGRTGLATCYDLRFPELFRALRDLRAESFLIPTGWPLARIAAWRSLAVARAIENQAWLLGCNSVGPSGGVPLGGDSVVIGPDGTVVAEAGVDDAAELIAEVAPETVRRLRGAFPVDADRRLEVREPRRLGRE